MASNDDKESCCLAMVCAFFGLFIFYVFYSIEMDNRQSRLDRAVQIQQWRIERLHELDEQKHTSVSLTAPYADVEGLIIPASISVVDQGFTNNGYGGFAKMARITGPADDIAKVWRRMYGIE